MSVSLLQVPAMCNGVGAVSGSGGGGGGGGVTSLIAGEGIQLTPPTGVGAVTVAVTSTGVGVTGLIAGGTTTTSATPNIVGAGGITATATADTVTLTYAGGASGVTYFAPPAGTALTPKVAGVSTATSLVANLLTIPAGLVNGGFYDIKLTVNNLSVTNAGAGSAGNITWTLFVGTSATAGENDLNSLFSQSQATSSSAPSAPSVTLNEAISPSWASTLFNANYDALDANVYLNVNISQATGGVLPDARAWTVGTWQYELVVTQLPTPPALASALASVSPASVVGASSAVSASFVKPAKPAKKVLKEFFRADGSNYFELVDA